MRAGTSLFEGRHARLAGAAFALTGALAAAGCSVASYEQPVSDFAGATEDAQSALLALNDQVTAAYAAAVRRQVLAGDGLVRYRNGDCLTGSERCRLVVVTRDGSEKTLSPDPPLRQTLALMRGIDDYAQGLAAIVAADTSEGIADNVNATIASVDSLAATVSSLSAGGDRPPVDTAAYTTAAGGLVSWAAEQYVARQKLAALRRATADSKPVVARAADLFTDAAEIAAVVPRAPLADLVAQRRDALDDRPTEANLDRLIESAAAYDRLLTARPPRVFQRLEAAHGALVDKLQGEELSLVVVIARIRAFQDEAKTLAGLLRDLAAAAQSPKTRETE